MINGHGADVPSVATLACPHCGSSDHVAKVNVLYMSGTNTATTVGVGGIYSGGSLNPGMFGALTRSQTLLSQRLAPPRQEINHWPVWVGSTVATLGIVVALGGFGGTFAAADAGGRGLAGLLAVSILLIGAWMIWWGVSRVRGYHRAIRLGYPAYQRRLAQWNASFYCFQCDRCFIPVA